MYIDSPTGGQTFHTEKELESIIALLDSCGGGEFWMGLTPGGFPCLNFVISDGRSFVIYYPEEGHPGFRCLDDAVELTDDEEIVRFVWRGCNPSDGEDVPREFVVPVEVTVKAAKKFLRDQKLPEGFDWFEL